MEYLLELLVGEEKNMVTILTVGRLCLEILGTKLISHKSIAISLD